MSKDLYIMLDNPIIKNEEFIRYLRVSNDKKVKGVKIEEIPNKTKVYRISNKDKSVYLKKSERKKEQKELVFIGAIKKTNKNNFDPGMNKKIISTKGLVNNQYYLTIEGHELLDEERDIRVAPLYFLIDRYLKDKNKAGQTNKKRIISLILRFEDQTMLLSYVMDEYGEIINLDYSIQSISEDLEIDEINEQALGGLSNIQGYGSSSENTEFIVIPEVLLYDYLTDGYKKDTYPVNYEFLYVSKMVVASGLLAVSLCILLGGFSFNKIQKEMLNNSIEERSSLMDRTPNVNNYKKAQIKKHVSYYVESKNIDYNNIFKASEFLSKPFFKIKVDADLNKVQINVYSDSRNIDNYYISKILNELPTPEGYVKGAVYSNGALENYGVKYDKKK